MIRKAYGAGAVKWSFWFVEFRKVVQLLSEGLSYEQIKRLNQEQNIFGTRSAERADMIFAIVTGRLKMLDASFIPLFLNADLGSQKLLNLVASLAYDTLFFDFVYEVIGEKLLLGDLELRESDLRVFFKNRQVQSDKVAIWQEYTLKRLGAQYKTMLYEAGIIDKGKETRKILRPIIDPQIAHWLQKYDLQPILTALTGVDA